MEPGISVTSSGLNVENITVSVHVYTDETGEFPAQMDSNAENISIWWRHHGIKIV